MTWWFGPAFTDPFTPREPLAAANEQYRPPVLLELLRYLGLTTQSSTTPSAENTSTSSPLFQLPPELRDEIYRFALLSPNTTLSLLTTSQQQPSRETDSSTYQQQRMAPCPKSTSNLSPSRSSRKFSINNRGTSGTDQQHRHQHRLPTITRPRKSSTTTPHPCILDRSHESSKTKRLPRMVWRW